MRDAEGRGHRGARVTPPPAELRDIREPAATEEPEQLELGVDAWLEPAVELDDQLVVDDHRRVRLLDTERTDVYPGRGREPPEGREVDSAGVGGDDCVAGRELDQPGHRGRLGEHVQGWFEVVARSRPREKLVDVVRPAAEANLEQRADERPGSGAEVDLVEDDDLGDLAVLRAEPALRGDELSHPGLGHCPEDPRGAVHSAGFRRRNQ